MFHCEVILLRMAGGKVFEKEPFTEPVSWRLHGRS